MGIRKLTTLVRSDIRLDAGKPTPARPAVDTARAECKRFVEAFGERGVAWFAEGKTFEEALEIHAASNAAELAKLRKELAETRRELARERNPFATVFGDTPFATYVAGINLPGKTR